MQNKKRTLFQGLQILTAAALALIIFLVWVNKRPSDKNVEILDQIRTVTLLDKGWQFHKGDSSEIWEDVTIPHDWAIYGPFSRDNDRRPPRSRPGAREACPTSGSAGTGGPWT